MTKAKSKHIIPCKMLCFSYSIQGLGKTGPDPSCDHILPDGVSVPVGKGKDQNVGGSSLLYNEYLFIYSGQMIFVEQ